MSSPAISIPTGASAVAAVQPAKAASTGPKPCCVCKDEKAARDECMLFSKSADAQKDCSSTIDKYKSCMAGFGFTLP